MKVGDIIRAKKTFGGFFEKDREYYISHISCTDKLIRSFEVIPISYKYRSATLSEEAVIDFFEKVNEMNYIEAMNYLMKDKNNRVILCGALYKFDYAYLYKNKTENYPTDQWYKIAPYCMHLLNGKFEIYKEELFTFDEIIEEFKSCSDSKSQYEIEDENRNITFAQIKKGKLVFESDDLKTNFIAELTQYHLKNKWRKVK
jgi:hypothetical protein